MNKFCQNDLTRNRPLIRLWCPRSKLNMDDFSIPTDSQVYLDATQEKEWNFLHALKGIGKGERLGIICIRYLQLIFSHNVIHLCQYSGKYPRLSRGRPGFNSPTESNFLLFFLLVHESFAKSILNQLNMITLCFFCLVHISLQNNIFSHSLIRTFNA